jgi:hypothetical protein
LILSPLCSSTRRYDQPISLFCCNFFGVVYV